MAEDNFKDDSDDLEQEEDDISEREDGSVSQQFDRIEYEALAERKRKAISNHQNGGFSKKARVNFDEVIVDMNLGTRRKGRKHRKKGRRKGSKKNLSPEVSRKLGEANLYYAKGQYEYAIQVLKQVVMLAPNLSETYHTLGLVYEEIGDKKKSMNFFMLAVQLEPQDHPFIWKRIFALSIGQGNVGQASYCLDKAIKVDPEDISLRFNRAALYVEVRNYQKAAEMYYEIVKLDSGNVEACVMAAKMYQKGDQVEQSVRILEEYISTHSSNADIAVTSLLICMLMETREYTKALQQFKHAQLGYRNGEQLPVSLIIKAGICQVHLGNIEEAEIHFSCLQTENVDVSNLVKEVAETCMDCAQYEIALKYYFKLEETITHDNGFLHLRIARCYQSMKERAKAIVYFYKVLSTMEDNVEIRVTLASLLVEEGKDDKAITLLSPPKTIAMQSTPWWNNGMVKKELARIYLAKGMVEEFVDTIFPCVTETLAIEYSNQKIKPRTLATPLELVRASKARRTLQKREEQKAAAVAAGLEWHSDDSDDESPQAPCTPPLPHLVKDGEHHQLVLDLCKALFSLKRYSEALKLIGDIRKLSSNTLSLDKKEQLKSIEAQIAFNTTGSTCAHAEARATIQRQPKSIAAWNHYYKIRIEKKLHKRTKFLNMMMRKDPKCIPPKIIAGHRFTFLNQHQEAASKYLEAYKLEPENPLINLSVGTSLINLALGLRVKNKHQCLAQGFAFLYNYLRLCENSQESLYNIARALHHVGLVTLAVSYYEKVLVSCEKDYLGYCDVRREAAYNLHLIYKTSGALDLARQVLRCHCTP